MFNNPFLKKDPLVEAVQSAMQDGDLRRQAEALVNEEFGVYSRKAVVREQLAAYDARLEEAYKCMKEGEKKDEKKEDKPKADYSKMREKMVGKGKDLETTRKIVGEDKADKDYDKDGKIESPKDEVWGSRFRAAKKAGKLKEAVKREYDDKDQSEHGVYKGKKKQGYVVSDKKTGTHTAYHNPQGDDDYGEVDDFPSKRKAVKQIKKSYNLNKEETQIDEVSAGLARRAAHHAFVKSDKMKKDAQKEPDIHSYVQAFHKGEKKSQQGTKFAKYAAKKMEEEKGDRLIPQTMNNPTGRDNSGASERDRGITFVPKNTRGNDGDMPQNTLKPEGKFSNRVDPEGRRNEYAPGGTMYEKVAGAILKRIRAKHMKEDSSFNAAQITGKSVNEVAMSMPPVVQQPAPAVRGPAARLQGTRFYRGINASTSGTGSARFVNPQTARVAPPAPKTGTSVVPAGNRMPAAGGSTGASASRSVAVSGSRNVTAAPKATTSGGSAFTYSRLGDREIGAAASGARSAARSIVSKVAGRALGVAGLAVPDSTKTEPGNPVFRKRDDGRTEVAGYRSSTTPRAGTSDVNTQKRMVGDMSRRSGMAPSVRNQELPSKIAPVQTKEPGTLSAPKPAAPTATPKTFGQAFAAARKEAGSGKGQFEFGGKKYQTNIAPAKGAEKYITPSAQKATSVGKTSTPSTSSVPSVSKPATSTTLPSMAQSGGGASNDTKSGWNKSVNVDSISDADKRPPNTEFARPRRIDVSQTPMPTASTPDVKASVSAAPETEKKPETSSQSYSPDSPAGKAWANRGKFGTQQEDKKMVAESFVSVGDYKYRIV